MGGLHLAAAGGGGEGEEVAVGRFDLFVGCTSAGGDFEGPS